MFRLSFLLVVVSTGVASAGPLTLFDFSKDEGGATIVNGQQIDDEFSSSFTVSVPFGVGVAAFDSTPGGPNDGDPQLEDMLVDLGNVLVYQSRPDPTQTVPGIFDTPRDDTAGGTIIFDFTKPTQPTSITLIDLDNNAGANVRLFDTGGKSRTYTVPDNWTFDRRVSPNGYADLDLTTLADQTGETAVVATAVEEAGFNAASVTRMEVQLLGSGGVDNLVVMVPEPTSIAGLVFAFLCTANLWRRR